MDPELKGVCLNTNRQVFLPRIAGLRQMDTKLSSTQILLLENLFIVKDTHSIIHNKRVHSFNYAN